MINSAPGFAVFDNGNVNLFVVSVGAGYGVVKDNIRNRHIYMKMAEAGVGLGMGIKDFRAVIVFHNQEVMDRFIHQGWQFGGMPMQRLKPEKKALLLAVRFRLIT
jgi:lipid-binding SYLF domain-containing protein